MLSREQFGVKALIDRGNCEYLFLLRSHPVHGETKPGWDIAGGRLNVDPTTNNLEDQIDGLCREIDEETGLKVLRNTLKVVGQQVLEFESAGLVIERTFFTTGPLQGEVILRPKEHTDFCEASIEQALGELQLNPYLRTFLEINLLQI